MLGPGEAQLLNLSVVPESRREGLGRALLMQFIDDARRLYAEQLFLEVRVGNRAAIDIADGTWVEIGATRDGKVQAMAMFNF